MKKERNKFWELFLSTLRISACTFGGGFVIVPLLKKRFVEELKWIEEEEMIDLISVSQTAPGPIAVNGSMMIGYRIGGVRGAMIAMAATIAPPLVILSVISLFYAQFRDNAVVSAALKGMQAGVAAILVNVVLDIGKTVTRKDKALPLCLMAGVFAAVYFLHIHIFWIILLCAGIGMLQGFLRRRKAGAGKK